MSEWKLSEGVMPCRPKDIVDVIYPGDITPSRAPAITCYWGDRRTQWKLVETEKPQPEKPQPEKPTAQAILRRAADLIEQRAEQRDQPNGEKSMAKTVQAFNTIYGTNLTEVQGWHFMELLKMVRSAYGVYVPDDFEDKVAYAALAAECQSQESA